MSDKAWLLVTEVVELLDASNLQPDVLDDLASRAWTAAGRYRQHGSDPGIAALFTDLAMSLNTTARGLREARADLEALGANQ
jgi:hypothetical protein